MAEFARLARFLHIETMCLDGRKARNNLFLELSLSWGYALCPYASSLPLTFPPCLVSRSTRSCSSRRPIRSRSSRRPIGSRRSTRSCSRIAAS